MSLMRKRVLLKSPVRENRTPGSVRGASSNRCPYRDLQLIYPPLAGRQSVRVPADKYY
jgi:hypothetical protein